MTATPRPDRWEHRDVHLLIDAENMFRPFVREPLGDNAVHHVKRSRDQVAVVCFRKVAAMAHWAVARAPGHADGPTPTIGVHVSGKRYESTTSHFGTVPSDVRPYRLQFATPLANSADCLLVATAAQVLARRDPVHLVLASSDAALARTIRAVMDLAAPPSEETTRVVTGALIMRDAHEAKIRRRALAKSAGLDPDDIVGLDQVPKVPVGSPQSIYGERCLRREAAQCTPMP